MAASIANGSVRAEIPPRKATIPMAVMATAVMRVAAKMVDVQRFKIDPISSRHAPPRPHAVWQC
jgi:hypothetical protein